MGRIRKGARTPIFLRFKTGSKLGWTSTIATFALSSAAAGLAGLVGIPVFIGIGLFSSTVGLCTAYLKGGGQIFPKNLVDEARNTETPYTCDYCTQATLAEACDLTRPHYRDEYVSDEEAETWREKNPKAFVHLMNRDGELSATFGVLALTPGFTDQFFKGNVTDLLLKSNDILDFEKSKKSQSLYISGVVVRDPDTHLGHKRAAAMIWAMVRYIEMLYGVRKKRILYAIAVTKASEKLMQNLGFTIACDRRRRQDRYHLYCFELTSGSWKLLKERVRVFGDSSAVCKCNF